MKRQLSGKIVVGSLVMLPLGLAFLGYTALMRAPIFIEGQPMNTNAPAPSEQTIDAERSSGVLPAPTGTSRITDASFRERGTFQQPVGDKFTDFNANGINAVADSPVSTFSIDVDTAYYSYIRQALMMGETLAPEAVRVEELINYFDYGYGVPAEGGASFASNVTVTPSPWSVNNRLVHIGNKGQRMEMANVAPANLVILIDTSGSINASNKLPLLKRAFGLLVNEMRPQDMISIVTYAGSTGVALEPTSASEKPKILAALDALKPSGSTAGAEGITTAYRLAEQAFIKGGTKPHSSGHRWRF